MKRRLLQSLNAYLSINELVDFFLVSLTWLKGLVTLSELTWIGLNCYCPLIDRASTLNEGVCTTPFAGGRDSKKVLSGFELKWLVKAVGDFLASRKVENDKGAF